MNLPVSRRGFTLIELSIVLVIIGLIVGGVLVGQDMISAAATRAQITQIEKYNTAVNTFKTKFAYLPGDIPDPYASNFGFQARGSYGGEGDGNGLLESNFNNTSGGQIGDESNCGENTTFWVDLTSAGMLDNSFTASHPVTHYGTNATGSLLTLFLPTAKLGSGNYVQTFSFNGNNYFSIAAVGTLGYGQSSNTGLTTQQAYIIDKKIDDGAPQSGQVLALYQNNVALQIQWAGNSGSNTPYTTGIFGTSSTCFDNGGGSGAQQYSTEESGGGLNCALSFKMQGAGR